MLQTRSILAESAFYDGIRVSILSTEARRDTVVANIHVTSGMFDVHCTNLAPPKKVIDALYYDKISFEQYKDAYTFYLRDTPNVQKVVRAIARYALTDNITIMCLGNKPIKSSRFILARECKMYEPDLYCLAK